MRANNRANRADAGMHFNPFHRPFLGRMGVVYDVLERLDGILPHMQAQRALAFARQGLVNAPAVIEEDSFARQAGG